MWDYTNISEVRMVQNPKEVHDVKVIKKEKKKKNIKKGKRRIKS